MPYLNQHRTFGFLPHGGCLPKDDCKETERDIDLIFCGSFQEPEEYFQIWKGYPVTLRKLLEDIIENALSKADQPLLTAAQEVIAAKNLYLDPHLRKNLLKLLPLADFYLRMKRRKECLEVLAEAGLKIKVFGNGWAKTSFAEHFELHPAVKFDELLKLVAKSKIVLNIVPSFVEGSHERVFTAMLNGAVALTDRNKYYEKEFKEGSNIVFYSWDNLTELPDRLNDLLCDQERLNFIAAEGKKVALQKHTWTVRALALLEMVENYKWLRKIS